MDSAHTKSSQNRQALYSIRQLVPGDLDPALILPFILPHTAFAIFLQMLKEMVNLGFREELQHSFSAGRCE
jgi:hypothetical protein